MRASNLLPRFTGGSAAWRSDSADTFSSSEKGKEDLLTKGSGEGACRTPSLLLDALWDAAFFQAGKMVRHERGDARGRGVCFVLGKIIKIKVEDAVGWGGGMCAVLRASTGLQASPSSGHMEVLCS